MKLIPLCPTGNKHKGKYFAQVDDSDFEKIKHIKWQFRKTKTNIYAKHFKLGAMHRYILSISDSKIHVDHKDMNGLNNQRDNLRIANRSQNGANRKSTGKTSKYLGVYLWIDKKAKPGNERKFTVRIRHNGIQSHLGRFNSEIEAAKAYDEAAKKIHGEFANLNFPAKNV